MINRFRIGADELILHLRKNNIAENISNDQLGKKIKNIIVDQLFGRLINEDVPVIWPINDENLINEFGLPKTAAKYEMTINKLSELFELLYQITS